MGVFVTFTADDAHLEEEEPKEPKKAAHQKRIVPQHFGVDDARVD